MQANSNSPSDDLAPSSNGPLSSNPYTSTDTDDAPQGSSQPGSSKTVAPVHENLSVRTVQQSATPSRSTTKKSSYADDVSPSRVPLPLSEQPSVQSSRSPDESIPAPVLDQAIPFAAPIPQFSLGPNVYKAKEQPSKAEMTNLKSLPLPPIPPKIARAASFPKAAGQRDVSPKSKLRKVGTLRNLRALESAKFPARDLQPHLQRKRFDPLQNRQKNPRDDSTREKKKMPLSPFPFTNNHGKRTTTSQGSDEVDADSDSSLMGLPSRHGFALERPRKPPVEDCGYHKALLEIERDVKKMVQERNARGVREVERIRKHEHDRKVQEGIENGKRLIDEARAKGTYRRMPPTGRQIHLEPSEYERQLLESEWISGGRPAVGSTSPKGYSHPAIRHGVLRPQRGDPNANEQISVNPVGNRFGVHDKRRFKSLGLPKAREPAELVSHKDDNEAAVRHPTDPRKDDPNSPYYEYPGLREPNSEMIRALRSPGQGKTRAGVYIRPSASLEAQREREMREEEARRVRREVIEYASSPATIQSSIADKIKEGFIQGSEAKMKENEVSREEAKAAARSGGIYVAPGATFELHQTLPSRDSSLSKASEMQQRFVTPRSRRSTTSQSSTFRRYDRIFPDSGNRSSLTSNQSPGTPQTAFKLPSVPSRRVEPWKPSLALELAHTRCNTERFRAAQEANAGGSSKAPGSPSSEQKPARE